MGGYFDLRLTFNDKERLDQARDNSENEQLRNKIRSYLATEYEKYIGSKIKSRTIAEVLGAKQNLVDFNLKILEEHGHVKLHETLSSISASLTREGKLAHDNPEQKIVFLSHAAVDEEIAKYLKLVIEEHFQETDVFVSSDPDDLLPGDPWVQTILDNLAKAEILLLLATERGLKRPWVWFEAGAEWSKENRLISICLGKVRKSNLPAPFSMYQNLNIDEEADLRILFQTLSSSFGEESKKQTIHPLPEI